MNNTDLEEILNNLYPCIVTDCDQNGTYATADEDGDPEPNQCQYCYEYRFPAIEKAKAQILEALSTSQREARLDELERLQPGSGKIKLIHGEWITVEDRIANLKAKGV